ncbi:serine endopeptidase [Diplocarpon rosae]|nr:serine endopeptidase [Diplocarpon rosae]
MASKFLAVLALALFPALSIAAAIPEAPALPTTQVGDGASIVGGSAASAGQFPYQLALLHGGSLFCGGVLLNAKTVLTAAHCSVDYAASDVSVRAGSLNYGSGGTVVKVSDILVHPDYDADTVNNDVAIWTLKDSLSTSSTIGYATLPAQGSDPASGVSTTVSGWGLTSEGGSTLPTALRYVSVPVVSRDTCNTDYGAGTITTNMFCAAATGKDSCNGDSGGPITITSTGVLAGTVSWGQGCAEDSYPGVYSRIGNYVNWINANLA